MSLEFVDAFAVAGPSREALLAYALMAGEQGGHSALQLWSELETWHGVRMQEVSEFQADLEAGGLLRENFMRRY